MSLHSWQAALIAILPDPAQAPAVLAAHQASLTAAEYQQLLRASQSHGLAVTRDVQHWWRQARLQTALPFSMRLLARLNCEPLLAGYLRQACETLFFLREAQAFANFLYHRTDAPALLTDMARFEVALHQARLRRDAATPLAPCNTSQATEQLQLHCCPEAVMLALLNDSPLPDFCRHEAVVGKPSVLIHINPQWPQLWRRG